MKILSTPTASTRKGITSIMIKVAGTPMNANKPTDDMTEASTIKTPPRPENYAYI